MKVITFHDIYKDYRGGEMYQVASAELQHYLNTTDVKNFQISHAVERDKYGRLHTHILLVHE